MIECIDVQQALIIAKIALQEAGDIDAIAAVEDINALLEVFEDRPAYRRSMQWRIEDGLGYERTKFEGISDQ